MKLSNEQLNDLRLGALTAIDGLWFLAVEERLGFEQAFELDLEVWKGYGLVQIKRLARMTGLELTPGAPHNLDVLSSLFEGMCLIDGSQCDWELLDGNTAVFNVRSCPWWDNLRRAGRTDVVNCEVVDETVFRHWLDYLDPSVGMEIVRSMPRGDNHCSWMLTRRHT